MHIKKRVFSLFTTFVMLFAIVGVMPKMEVAAELSIESAVQWAINKANDNSCGYSQAANLRWGPSYYDCSSFVITALKNAGFNVGGATYTGNMRSNLTANGFTWIPWSQISSVSNLKRGDILLNEATHTEFYIGNNQNVGAHSSNRAWNDQVSVSGYYNHPWNGVLRYDVNGVPPTWANVSVPKQYFKIGEEVAFKLTSDTGNSYTIGIDTENVNGERTRIDTQQIGIDDSHIYTRSFDKPGRYSCYITAYNNYGLIDSERIFFTVCDSKPEYVSVSLIQNVYRVGENITFNLSSDTGSSYTVGIDDASGNRVDTYDTEKNYYMRSFDTPGKYSCYITTYNEYGLADSERIYFTVYDSKPEYAYVSLIQNVYQVGENVTFNLSSDSGYSYTIGIDDANGNRIDTYETTHGENYYTRSFDTPGKYSCYITTYNECGLADSERIYFTIYDSKPNYVEVSIDKDTYYVGEKVTFNLLSDSGYSYTVGIDDSDGRRIDTYETIHGENYYTRSFDTPGNYSCYITTYNAIGFADSKRVAFKVLAPANYGDLNGDGNISVSDVESMQKYLVKKQTFTKEQFAIADMNLDGQVNVFDVVILKRRILKG